MLTRAMIALSGGSLAAWMDGPAQNHVHEDIALRFAYEGDSKSGNWEPLAEGTNAIRQALGFPPVTPINIRTGELERAVTEQDQITTGPDWAVLDIPGDDLDPLTRRKLETAQAGRADNPISGFGATPARPVLAVDESDMMVLLDTLAAHIIYQIIGVV